MMKTLLLLLLLLSSFGLPPVFGGGGSLRQRRESLPGITNYASILQDSFDRPWSNLAGASCPVGTSASSSVIPYGFSHRMVASGFNFSVAEYSNITAIRVRWDVSLSLALTPRLHELEVSVFADGGDNASSVLWHAQPITYSGSEGWNTTVGSISYPRPGDDPLWGTQWNASAVNSAPFGSAIRVTNPAGTNVPARIHCIEIAIDYLPPVASSTGISATTASVTTGVSTTTTTTTTTAIATTTATPSTTGGTTAFSTTGVSTSTSASTAPSATSTTPMSTTGGTTTTGLTAPSTGARSTTGAFTATTSAVSQSTVEVNRGDATGSSLDPGHVLVIIVVITLVACVAASTAIYVVLRSWGSPSSPFCWRGGGAGDDYELTSAGDPEAESLVLTGIIVEEALQFPDELPQMHKGMMCSGTTRVVCERVADPSTLPERGSLMRPLRHQNIAQTYGIFYNDVATDGDDIHVGYLVTEFVSDTLLSDLLQRPVMKGAPTVSLLLSLALDISSAMSFLESKKIVHGLLMVNKVAVAANNGSYTAKLVDLNMVGRPAKGKGKGKGTHHASTPPPEVLHRWCSPETLERTEYSTKSDVWCYAVLLWQLFARGARPHIDLEDGRVKDWICAGGHIPDKAPDCPSRLHRLMADCWSRNASSRPGFQRIHTEIEEVRDELFPSTAEDDKDTIVYADMSKFRDADEDEGKPEDADDPMGPVVLPPIPDPDAGRTSSFYASPGPLMQAQEVGDARSHGSDPDEIDTTSDPIQSRKKKKKKKTKKTKER